MKNTQHSLAMLRLTSAASVTYYGHTCNNAQGEFRIFKRTGFSDMDTSTRIVPTKFEFDKTGIPPFHGGSTVAQTNNGRSW